MITMLKVKVLCLFLMSLFLVSCTADDKQQYDTQAVANLDALSNAIGELASVSYSFDVIGAKKDGSEYANQHDVYMRGPDKMYIHSSGSIGKRSIWYNGNTLGVFSYDKNSFASIDAPDDIIKTIDFVNTKYGIDFPAGDFFYPDFTDNILNQFDHVLFLGDTEVDGNATISVLASNAENDVQIWISKALNLPIKLLIESKVNPDEYYLASFSNFRANPELPDSLFEFSAPPNSDTFTLTATQ